MILASPMAMYARDTKPRRGGSKKGWMKSKPRLSLEWYRMLYSDYFTDNPSHKADTFQRAF
jgi:hypothetical protein